MPQFYHNCDLNRQHHSYINRDNNSHAHCNVYTHDNCYDDRDNISHDHGWAVCLVHLRDVWPVSGPFQWHLCAVPVLVHTDVRDRDDSVL